MVAIATTHRPLLHVIILTHPPIVCHRSTPQSHHYLLLVFQIHRLHPSKSVNQFATANYYSQAIYNKGRVEILRKWPTWSIQSRNWAETSGTVHGNRLWRIGNILTHHARILLQWRTGIQLFSGQGRRRWNSDNVKLLLLNLSMCEFYFTECWSCWHLLFQV
jgi:hypothetical protein